MIGPSTSNAQLADVLDTIEPHTDLTSRQLEALDEAIQRLREMPDEED